ncbi:hypothetical protein N7504_004232 [Penicillium tannophilum]|nr:hypothetical protein N7504_004232 [Penicillium tannophilum]
MWKSKSYLDRDYGSALTISLNDPCYEIYYGEEQPLCRIPTASSDQEKEDENPYQKLGVVKFDEWGPQIEARFDLPRTQGIACLEVGEMGIPVEDVDGYLWIRSVDRGRETDGSDGTHL